MLGWPPFGQHWVSHSATLNVHFSFSSCLSCHSCFPFSLSLYVKCWCFKFCLYTSSLLILQILKFSLVDLTYSLCSCCHLSDKNSYPGTDSEMCMLFGSLTMPFRNFFSYLLKLGLLKWTRPRYLYINYIGNDSSWKLAM